MAKSHTPKRRENKVQRNTLKEKMLILDILNYRENVGLSLKSIHGYVFLVFGLFFCFSWCKTLVYNLILYE